MLLFIYFYHSYQIHQFLNEKNGIKFAKANGQYTNTNYINLNKIPTSSFSYLSTGDQTNHPISNVFEDISSDSYWIAKTPNNATFHNKIFINFIKPVTLEAILYEHTFLPDNSNRYFIGFPLILKIYSSLTDNEPSKLEAVFTSRKPTSKDWTVSQLVFNQPIYCKKLEIEYVQLTDGYPTAKKIHLIQKPDFLATKKAYSIEPKYYNSSINESNTNNFNFSYTHSISPSNFSFSSTGDDSRHPLSNLFDHDHRTFWVSDREADENFKPTIFINFSTPKYMEAIGLYTSYSTRFDKNYTYRIYYGYPVVLKVYASLNNEPFYLHTVFTGHPSYPMSLVYFVFEAPFVCDKLKIEFSEVTEDTFFSNGLKRASSCEMFLFGLSDIPDETVMTNPDGLINVTCDMFSYIDDWGICSNVGSITQRPGSKLSYTFTGTRVHVLVYKQENSGKALIRIDGNESITVNLDLRCGSTEKCQQSEIIYSSGYLLFGVHTIEIEHVGQQGQMVTISCLYIDPLPKIGSFKLGFDDFKDRVGVWTIDESTPAIFSSDSEDASGIFRFVGTEFWLTGVRGRSLGSFYISIDGGSRSLVDLRNNEPTAQNNRPFLLYHRNALQFELHQVKIEYRNDPISLINFMYTTYPYLENFQNKTILDNPEGLINVTCDKFDYINWVGGICTQSEYADHGSYSSRVGSKIVVNFIGTKVHILVHREYMSGSILIQIDDELATTVNLSSNSSYLRYTDIAFSSGDLPYGEHSLKITHITNGVVVIASVYVDPLPKDCGYKLDFNDFKENNNNWILDTTTQPPIFTSNVVSASGVFEFSGTRFWLTGVRGRSIGNFQIIIDGGIPIDVNESQNSGYAQNNFPVLLYQSEELEFKQHRVKIQLSIYRVSIVNLLYTTYPYTKDPSVKPTTTPTESIFSSTQDQEISNIFVPSPIPTPIRTPIPQAPISISTSNSDKFEITSLGFIDNTNSQIYIDNTTDLIKGISFSNQNIEIHERSPYYSIYPLYFIPLKANSIIKIDKNLSMTSIGIYSDNHPSVLLYNEESSFLSLMNQVYPSGEITIITDSDTNFEKIHLNEINNQMGDLTLYFPSTVNEISVKKLMMQFYSKLILKRLISSKMNKLDVNSIKLNVFDDFTVNDDSEVTIDNLCLSGKLNINSNSILVIEKDITFSENSTIEIFVKQIKEEPIFIFDGNVNNSPKKIILNVDSSSLNQKINLVKTSDNQIKCNQFTDHVYVALNDKEVQINRNDCDDSSEYIVLSISNDLFNNKNKNEGGKKFPIGAIIGIVVGVIVVIAVVVVILFLLKRRKSSQSISKDEIAVNDNTNENNDKDSITEDEANVAI